MTGDLDPLLAAGPPAEGEFVPAADPLRAARAERLHAPGLV